MWLVLAESHLPQWFLSLMVLVDFPVFEFIRRARITPPEAKNPRKSARDQKTVAGCILSRACGA
jgi:hypothetical protein